METTASSRFSSMSFLRISTWALLEPNSTPSGTMTAARPPHFEQAQEEMKEEDLGLLALDRQRRVHVGGVDRAFEGRIGEDDVVALALR